MISVYNWLFDFYMDPQDLSSDGRVHKEMNPDNETVITIDLRYDTSTGVLQEAQVASKSIVTGEIEGYAKFTLIDTNIKPGDLKESTGTQTTTSAVSTGTIYPPTPSTVGLPIKDGDWATYRITFDIKASTGEYAKGSATFKVTFSVTGNETYYDITDVNVESFDTNTENASESDVEGFIRTLSYISPFAISMESLPPSGVIENQTGDLYYKLHYDTSTGLLKSATMTVESTEGSGAITITLLDTSVKTATETMPSTPTTTTTPTTSTQTPAPQTSQATQSTQTASTPIQTSGGAAGQAQPGSSPSPTAGVGGLGGLTTIILIVAVIVVIAVVGIVVVLKRRKPRTTPYSYTPPPPPPPPPQ